MKKLYLVIIIIILAPPAFSQSYLAPSIQWSNCFGSTGTDRIQSVQPTPDGGYLTVGHTDGNNFDISQNHGKLDVLVVKVDNVGSIQWQKCFGGTEDDLGYDIKSTLDGGYIIAGSSRSNSGDATLNKGSDDAWVIKIDSVGLIQWQKSYGSSKTDIAVSIHVIPGGGYIVAGECGANDGDVTGFHTSSNPSSGDAWIWKIDSIGNIIWQKPFGGSNGDYASKIILTSDGGYLFVGSTNSDDGDVNGLHQSGSSYNYDVWVVKITANGILQYQKCYGSTAHELGRDVIQTNGGGYIFAGNAGLNNGDVSGAKGSIDMWVVKLNSSGILEWQKCLGGSDIDEGYKIRQLSDGGYLIGGWTNSNDGDVDIVQRKSNTDFWLIKLDVTGNIIQWQRVLGGQSVDQLFALEETNDGGYIIAGGTQSNSGDASCSSQTLISFKPNCWIVKLSSQVLPLTLTDFKLTQTNQGIILKWQTTNEVNFSHFVIERSNDGVSFHTIATVPSKNVGTSTKTYSYTDANYIQVSKLYYRLKMVDKDGSFTYSTVVTTTLRPVESVTISPNPANSLLNILSQTTIKQVTIIDAAGRIYRVEKGNDIATINISSLPTGVYYLQIFDGKDKANQVTFIKK